MLPLSGTFKSGALEMALEPTVGWDDTVAVHIGTAALEDAGDGLKKRVWKCV